MMNLPPNIVEQVAAALGEDIGAGDVTAQLVPPAQRVKARIITRDDAVLCGTAWVDETFRQLDPQVTVSWFARDAEPVAAGATLCDVTGPARAILTGERTALNFLQTLSATASAARLYVDAVAGTSCTILDTRKTLPGLRLAQKYATRCGGAQNHRLGLHDMVLIKENHILACGSIARAIAEARRTAPAVRVEVEVESLAELEQALDAAPDMIMLDEFPLENLREAVRRTRARGSPVKLEASGGVSMQTVRTIARTGVDFISVGGITKHVRAVDLSMRVEFADA